MLVNNMNTITDERLAKIREEFESELENAMHQPPQWQKHPREMVAICEELIRCRAALESIANNTCCASCQEASLVAKSALSPGGPTRE